MDRFSDLMVGKLVLVIGRMLRWGLCGNRVINIGVYDVFEF